MKRVLWLLAVACLLLTGCATVYTKAGKTADDFEKDRKTCETLVRKELVAKGVNDT